MTSSASDLGSLTQQNWQSSAKVFALQTELLSNYIKQVNQVHQELITSLQREPPPPNPFSFNLPTLNSFFAEYMTDLLQRHIIFWDTLRERGDAYRNYIEHGQPPVLTFNYKLLLDGRTFERPVNYGLIQIQAPPGITTDVNKRPFVIVDPRSGHGPGISGFKEDSQVGQALRAGHPVYFVLFFPEPEAQQTLIDIATAEEYFLRTVAKRHPNSPKLCVIGNCQGGWAMLTLAAAHPELAGAIIANGVPIAYWAGQNGKNPLRYIGGLLGGSWIVQHAGDLGNGKFDGAHLIMNFALINPVASYWKKYYDLFANIDHDKQRYLDLERWLGGFTSMNTHEMRTIADNLFIGNKLIRGKIPLNQKNNLDLRNIRTPLIIFCSQGDHVVPPQQALHWISDIYSDTLELKLEGQVIVYLIHESVGHLGLFMSSKVAKKEHRQLIDFLNHIEHLPPGLYEMIIHEQKDGSYYLTLEERGIEDIKKLHEEHKLDNQLFDFVHAISNFNATGYDLFIGPWVRHFTQEYSSNIMRDMHPLRMSRYLTSKLNPNLWPYLLMAPIAQNYRHPVSPDNPFLLWQRYLSSIIFTQMNAANESRDALIELLFHALYGSLYEWTQLEPYVSSLIKHDNQEIDYETAQEFLTRSGEGGLPDAVIRILLILIKTQGFTKVSHLSDGINTLRKNAIFSHFNDDEFRQILQNQTVIVEYNPEQALKSLPQLLQSKNDKTQALTLIKSILNAMGTPILKITQLKMRDIQTVLDHTHQE